jgi:hypothetical protein
MTNERLANLIVKEEQFRSDYAANFAADLLREHRKEDAAEIVRKSIADQCRDMNGNMQQIVGMVMAAYLGMPVLPRLREFIIPIGAVEDKGMDRWAFLK